MNETGFVVERAEAERIDIRDHQTRLRLTFPIIDRKLDVAVGDEFPIDEAARREARAFAEDEARERDLIDAWRRHSTRALCFAAP
jgi:hypothetical protein